jgi:hypothetical protein
MSDANPTPAPKQPISLDPENTPQGAMERIFLAETHGPGNSKYVAGTDLEQMWDMRQVIETRLKNLGKYDAPGAKDETDIVTMGNQIQGFSNYPNLDGDLPTRIDNNWQVPITLRIRNKPPMHSTCKMPKWPRLKPWCIPSRGIRMLQHG